MPEKWEAELEAMRERSRMLLRRIEENAPRYGFDTVRLGTRTLVRNTARPWELLYPPKEAPSEGVSDQ